MKKVSLLLILLSAFSQELFAFNLSIQKSGKGKIEGTLLINKKKVIDCGTTCNYSAQDIALPMSLVAKPDNGYEFKGWSGTGRVDKQLQTQINTVGNKVIKAEFAQIIYPPAKPNVTISLVNLSGKGAATLISSGASSCGSGCYSVIQGADVTLIAIGLPGANFRWVNCPGVVIGITQCKFQAATNANIQYYYKTY